MLAEKELYKNVLEELIPFNKFLNMQMVEIRDGYCKLMVPFQPHLIGDPRGPALHGGVIAAAMDAVGGMAGATTLSSYEESLSTIDMRVDYLRPGKAKDLFVEGQIARSGNRIIVTRMIAYHEDASHLIAEGKGVYNVKRKSDKKTND
jgi:uncharacterized protein (TIGR00369 family)